MTIFKVLYFVAFLFRRQRSQNDEGGAQGRLAACCNCSMRLLGSILRSLNTNAYVVANINSESFCSAALTLVSVMAEETGAVVVLEGVTKVAQLFGVIAISGTGSGLTWLVLRSVLPFANPDSEHFVPQPEVLAAAAGVVSFAIAAVFMNVLDVVSDTILISWVLDRRHRLEAGLEPNARVPVKLRAIIDGGIREDQVPLIELRNA